jgi:uncharacterized membrane protein
MSAVFTHVRTRMTSGLLLILPLVITLWLLKLVFGLVNDNVTPWVMRILLVTRIPETWHLNVTLLAPMIGLFLTLLIVYAFGLLAGNLAGRRLWALVEAGILRVPLVKRVYGSARQLLDSFSAGGSGGFSRVVLLEYPRQGVWTIGFVTNENAAALAPNVADGSPVAVFMPTTPNPTSGWLAIVPAKAAIPLDISVEEGIKLVVSGGFVLPRRKDRSLAPPAAGPARL